MMAPSSSWSVRLRLARASAEKEGARSKVDLLDGLATDANDALENLRDLARGIYPPCWPTRDCRRRSRPKHVGRRSR